MAKIILYGMDAKQKLSTGADKLAQAVGSTLGARGQNVAIDRGYDMLIVHDGVTVAKAVELEDKAENAGVRIVREAANKQVDQVGDGTTAVTILAAAIIKECLKVTSAGVNPMSLRNSLEAASRVLIEELEKLSTPIQTLDQKIQIASISAEDNHLGEMIAKELHEIGVEGIITVEESKSSDTFIERQEGMQFDKGFVSPYFITDPARNEATVEEAYVVISDREMSNIFQLEPLLKKIANVSKNCVFISPEHQGSFLQSMILTKMQGGMNVLCVQAPLFGQKQKDFLADIAALTGGKVISEDAGMKYENVELEDLGRATRVTSTKDATIIIGGAGTQDAITERVEQLKAELDRNEGSEWEMEKLRERIAKLHSGVSVLKVGGHTEIEMKERKERAIDAVAATRAAIMEGIIPGGEVAYLTARKSLSNELSSPGVKIIYDAVEKPFHKLMENAGLEPGRLMALLETSKVKNAGVDVVDAQVKDMVKVGIVDPTKVAKSAIKNAVSVAVQVMTTNVLIIPEEKKEKVNG